MKSVSRRSALTNTPSDQGHPLAGSRSRRQVLQSHIVVMQDATPGAISGALQSRPATGKFFKDGLLPFDCNEVRRCLLFAKFLKEPLARPRIVVDGAIYLYSRFHRRSSLIRHAECLQSCQKACLSLLTHHQRRCAIRTRDSLEARGPARQS
jgi:hypothetical protein